MVCKTIIRRLPRWSEIDGVESQWRRPREVWGPTKQTTDSHCHSRSLVDPSWQTSHSQSPWTYLPNGNSCCLECHTLGNLPRSQRGFLRSLLGFSACSSRAGSWPKHGNIIYNIYCTRCGNCQKGERAMKQKGKDCLCESILMSKIFDFIPH